MNVLGKIKITGKFIKNKLWWLGLILALYVLIFRVIIVRIENKKFENTSCMTIGYVLGRAEGRAGGIEYIYYVNGMRYKGEQGSGFNWVKTNNGGKYLIKYMCDNPQDALIYFDKPIKGDTIPAEYLK